MTLPSSGRPWRCTPASSGAAPSVEVFESERHWPFVGWKEPNGQIDEFFTAKFGDVRGAGSTPFFKDVPLPEGWRWDGQWRGRGNPSPIISQA